MTLWWPGIFLLRDLIALNCVCIVYHSLSHVHNGMIIQTEIFEFRNITRCIIIQFNSPSSIHYISILGSMCNMGAAFSVLYKYIHVCLHKIKLYIGPLFAYWLFIGLALCVDLIKLITGYGNGPAGNKLCLDQFIDELCLSRAQWVDVDLKNVTLINHNFECNVLTRGYTCLWT